MPFIKPVDESFIRQQFAEAKRIFVLEEHSIYGGLGSLFAEIFSETGGPRIKRIGIQDRFSEKCGSYQYLLREHKLDFESVAKVVEQCLREMRSRY